MTTSLTAILSAAALLVLAGSASAQPPTGSLTPGVGISSQQQMWCSPTPAPQLTNMTCPEYEGPCLPAAQRLALIQDAKQNADWATDGFNKARDAYRRKALGVSAETDGLDLGLYLGLARNRFALAQAELAAANALRTCKP